MQATRQRSAFALAFFAVLNVQAAEDAVVVTATRFPEIHAEQPVNMTVISAEQIRRSPARTLPDLLGEQVGIQARDLYGNNAAAASVDMRGFGATAAQNTLILIDGRRVNDIDQSGIQWSAVPLANIERVEILRGAGGVLYGEGATAGVINIITRTPINAAPEVRVEGLVGSHGTLGKSLSGQMGTERFGFALSARDFKSDGYRAHNRNEQSNLSADARWQLSSGTLNAKLAADRQELGLPAGRQIRPSTGLDQYSTDRRGARTPLDYSSRDGNQATLDYDRPTGWGGLNIGLGYRDKDQRAFFDQGGFPTYINTELNLVSFTPRARIEHAFMGIPLEWTVGADWYSWDYRRRVSNTPANFSRPINRIAATQENLGAYVHGTAKMSESWIANLGVRSETQKIRASDTYDATAPGGAFGSAAPAADLSDGEIAYEFGLRYQVNAATVVTGRAGRNFRFANVDEIYEFSAVTFAQQFQFLRPQRARPMEIALEQRRPSWDYRIALFRIDVMDEIHLDPFTLGVGNRNMPPSRRQGLELEGRWSPAADWVLRGAYTLSTARFREGVLPGNAGVGTNLDVAGKNVPLVPRHKLNVTASWAATAATKINVGMTHVARQYLDNDEMNSLSAQIPAYTVADVKLSYERNDWDVRLGVNNLFNRKYYNYAVRSNFTPDLYEVYPLPERSVSLTAAYRFR